MILENKIRAQLEKVTSWQNYRRLRIGLTGIGLIGLTIYWKKIATFEALEITKERAPGLPNQRNTGIKNKNALFFKEPSKIYSQLQLVNCSATKW